MITGASKKFTLPSSLHAAEPPEERGLRRDQVRLMITDKETGKVTNDSFRHLDRYLEPGDLLILNNSRTIPAVLYAGLINQSSTYEQRVELRLARKTAADSWDVLIMKDSVSIGDKLIFKDHLEAEVIGHVEGSPLWSITFKSPEEEVFQYVLRYGNPIRYEYTEKPWELNFYQTVFATVPGSVEMPSAGRPFSWEMLFGLQKKGIKTAFIQLHTGLSYMTEEYWPIDPKTNRESYHVPEITLKMLRETRAAGKRVIAVGTTVVRSLETVASTHKHSGTTDLYIGPDFTLKMVDGILTGFHEPEASHLDLLSAFIKKEKLLESYYQAIEQGYLWHEFGDMNLII